MQGREPAVAVADPGKPNRAVRGNEARFLAFLGLSLAVLGFWVLSRRFTGLDCLVLFPLLSLLAWPIWEYQREYTLFHRRAVLEGITQPQSRVRSLFWKGTITQAFQAIVSLLLAALLLVLSSRLNTWHWIVLALDIPLLVLLAGPTGRLLAAEVRPDRLAMASRRWPLLLVNGTLLAGAFLVIDFNTGVPDTRGMEWHRIAESAFTSTSEGSACRLSGWAAGTAQAINALSWHATQMVIPNLPDTRLKYAAWFVFLVQAGAIAYLYTRLLLGIVSLAERRPRRGGITASGAFIGTILVLAVPYFYATVKLSGLDPEAFDRRARSVLDWTDPCGDPDTRRARIAADLGGRLEQQRQQAISAADERIDAGVDALFAEVEKGVDAYLDWYFTVLGEYERLIAVFGGDVAATMARQVETQLFADTGFTEGLQRLNREVYRDSTGRLSATAAGLSVHAASQMGRDSCTPGTIDLTDLAGIDRDGLRASAAAASGTAIGVVTAKALASKTASAVAAKVAAKKSFQAAAALTTKAVAKKGGSILVSAAGAAAICSPGGAMALVCGVGAGMATWLAVDKVLVEVDEALNRDEMREEMLAAVRAQRPELAAALKLKHHAMIDAMAGRIHEAVERSFVPARDGL